MAKNVLQRHWNGTNFEEIHPVTKALNVFTSDGKSIEQKVNEHLAEKATTTKLGHVMVGSGLTINSQGKLSAIPPDIPESIPKGIITMWSGATTAVPTGWALCNGTNGTPNLVDRFIVGAGGQYAVGATGGADSVTLTTNQLPSHSHSSGTLSASSAGSHSHGSGTLTTDTTGAHTHPYLDGGVGITGTGSSLGTGGSYIAQMYSKTTSSAGAHNHSISGSTDSAGSHSHSISGSTGSNGSGQAHENRPPFYAIAYIMKL